MKDVDAAHDEHVEPAADVAQDAFLPAISRPPSCYAVPARSIRLAKTSRNDES